MPCTAIMTAPSSRRLTATARSGSGICPLPACPPRLLAAPASVSGNNASTVQGVAFSPDGTYLAAEKHVAMWICQTLKVPVATK